MTMEISQIGDKVLRKAAEKADTDGNLNGKLDGNEMSVFVKEAYSKGCTAEEITAITGTKTEDKDLAKLLASMNEIESKKKELEATRNEIANKNDPYKDNRESRAFNMSVKSVTGVLGGAAGVGAFFGLVKLAGLRYNKLSKVYNHAILSDSAQTVLDRLRQNKNNFMKIYDAVVGKTSVGSITRLCLFAAAGVVGGIFAGKAIAKKTNVFGLKPHSVKVAEKQSAEYNQTEIEPLKAKAAELENEIKDMETAFQEM